MYTVSSFIGSSLRCFLVSLCLHVVSCVILSYGHSLVLSLWYKFDMFGLSPLVICLFIEVGYVLFLSFVYGFH